MTGRHIHQYLFIFVRDAVRKTWNYIIKIRSEALMVETQEMKRTGQDRSTQFNGVNKVIYYY